MQKIRDEIEKVRQELTELEGIMPNWNDAQNITGSRKVRSIAERIVLSAKRLESLVKENSFRGKTLFGFARASASMGLAGSGHAAVMFRAKLLRGGASALASKGSSGRDLKFGLFQQIVGQSKRGA